VLEGGFGGGSGALESREPNPEDKLLDAEIGLQRWQAVSEVLAQLDARERYIVEQRLMAHREEALSLADIGRHFRFSRERARQLEQRAMHKVHCKIEVLAQVAQREHRGLVLVLEVARAPHRERRHEASDDVESRSGVEPCASCGSLELRSDEDQRADSILARAACCRSSLDRLGQSTGW
jgi:hypothetical protein